MERKGAKNFDNSVQNIDKKTVGNKVLSKISLRNILNIETLQGIQENLTSVVGLSMVTVDYKGEPITQKTGFSDFCKARREIGAYKKNCFFSDAYGGLKAAMSNSPYIYCCPAGLVDCAIPIIINDQHLGTVLMGQVRCSNTESLEKLDQFIKEDIVLDDYPELKGKFEKTAILELDRIEMISSLVQFLINEMVEKQIALLVQSELERENSRLLTEIEIKDNKIVNLEKMEKNQTKVELHHQFMMSIMNSISSLSLIEGAEQTNELACLFANMLRFTADSNDDFINLDKEMDNIEDYLKIQKIRFGEKIEYQVQIECLINNKRIPPLLLLPILENAVIHGILQKKGIGRIIVIVRENKNDVEIIIEDDGVGISDEKIKKIMKNELEESMEKKHIKGLSIKNTRKRLIQYFGESYDMQISSNLHRGVTVKMSIPQNVKKDAYI